MGHNGRLWQVHSTYLNTERKREVTRKEKVDEKRKCCAFTWGSHAVMISQLLSKLNALGLSTRKWTKLFMMILHGCVDGLCVSHSITICSHV